MVSNAWLFKASNMRKKAIKLHRTIMEQLIVLSKRVSIIKKFMKLTNSPNQGLSSGAERVA